MSKPTVNEIRARMAEILETGNPSKQVQKLRDELESIQRVLTGLQDVVDNIGYEGFAGLPSKLTFHALDNAVNSIETFQAHATILMANEEGELDDLFQHACQRSGIDTQETYHDAPVARPVDGDASGRVVH